MKYTLNKLILPLIFTLVLLGYGMEVFAQSDGASQSVLYVPLIGITSVPEPLALPSGPGNVTYHFAVKNFLKEVALREVTVVDDHCGAVLFREGDDNDNALLEYGETWRYSCEAVISTTTQSIATASGKANYLSASHKAYTTVVVGSDILPPLVSIINITKVAYPLSLPVEGGLITFTYKVNNPGSVPLQNVSITDDKCRYLSNKLGDTNGNNELDTNEVWIYTCTAHLSVTTTNTVKVSAFANGREAISDATITVEVAAPLIDIVPDFQGQPIASFPETGARPKLTIVTWGILGFIFLTLSLYHAYFLPNKQNHSHDEENKIY